MLVCARLSDDSEPRWMTELSEHLEPVLANARSIENKKNRFYENYISWRHVSEQAINSTTEIRDAIVDTNRKANYVSAGTTATGIAGSIMSIIGVCAAVPTGGVSLALTGGAILLTGSAVVSVGSNITQNVIKKSSCEEAVKNMEINKTSTMSFNEECRSYFETLDNFNSHFDTISGNDVALSLFYEAADEEGLSFLNDLRLDRWSRNQVRSALEEIIESDVTKLNPKMWSAEFVKGASNKMKILAEKIRKEIHEIKKTIESDLYLSNIFLNKFREFFISKLRSTGMHGTGQLPRILTTGGKYIAAAISVPVSFQNVKSSLQEMSKVTRASLVALNAVCLVIGIYSLTKTLVNLENGSQSEESRNITKAINNLKKSRNKVIEEIERLFGW